MVSTEISLESQYLIILSCSLLSIIGSLFIISIYLYFYRFRILYTKIIFCIAISDLFRALSSIVPCNYISSWAVINLIATINSSSFLITIIWSAYISVALYQKIQEHEESDSNYWIHVTWISTICLSCLPMITNSHGVTGTTCTVSLEGPGKYWRLGILYIPASFLLVLSIYTSCRVYQFTRIFQLNEEKSAQIKKLFLYPIVMIIEITPLTIIMIYYSIAGTNGLDIVTTTAFSLHSLHGFCNAIIYGVTLGLENLKREFNTDIYCSLQRKANETLCHDDSERPNLLSFSESLN